MSLKCIEPTGATYYYGVWNLCFQGICDDMFTIRRLSWFRWRNVMPYFGFNSESGLFFQFIIKRSSRVGIRPDLFTLRAANQVRGMTINQKLETCYSAFSNRRDFGTQMSWKKSMDTVKINTLLDRKWPGRTSDAIFVDLRDHSLYDFALEWPENDDAERHWNKSDQYIERHY